MRTDGKNGQLIVIFLCTERMACFLRIECMRGLRVPCQNARKRSVDYVEVSLAKMGPFLTTIEVAALTGLSRDTIRRYGRTGRLDAIKVGAKGQRLFQLSEVERLLRDRQGNRTGKGGR
jgi:excisionase family DNA binding protein